MKDKIRVLVVDDDRRMVKTICDILRVKGFEAFPALTGEEAVESVKAHSPDCVLMDIKMPGIGGVAAQKMIKDLRPGIPVILMSAYATDEMIAQARQQGVYTVLSKPVDLQLILSFLALLHKEESILIVDDDPVFCKTLGDILQSRGYRVETEGDAEKVLGHMEQNYKLVVILDLKLGRANGLDVLKTLRAKYPQKPVVLVTGYRDDMADSIRKGLAIGASACLYKPFEVEALIALIEEISRKQLKGALEKTL